MLEHSESEGIHYWKVARTYFGQSIYTTGFYWIDDVLIDCGPPNAFRILKPVFSGVTAKRLLITHHHEDHTGNALYLSRERGCEVLGHEAGAEALKTISGGLPFYRRVVWGVPEACSYRAVEPSLETSKRVLVTIATPGHSEDHVCFFDPGERLLFTGDLYLSGYLRYLRSDENIYELMRSLRTLIQLRPRMLFCNHRGPVDDGEAALARKLSFLETLRDEVLNGIGAGMKPEELAKSLLKKDTFFRRFSGGEFSSINLIRALAGSSNSV